MTNTSDLPYTAGTPATFVDALPGVLDDAFLVAGPTASTGTVTVVGSQIVWSGPLTPGETVTVTYTMKAIDGGDGFAVNIAFVTDLPIDPTTGLPTDPATGEPVTPPSSCPEPTCATTATSVSMDPVPVAVPLAKPTPLALTGAQVMGNLLVAVGLLAIGGLLVLGGRRHRS